MSLLSVAARTVTDWMKLGFPEEVAKRIVAGGVAATAATQSDDAEAGFVTRGGKTLLEAWHGSPHKFDKFSMDAIGTGEGAQAYGHGLYFADSEDVARGYRDALTQISPTALDGFAVPDSAVPYLQEVFDGDDPIMSSAASELLAGDFSPSQIRSKVAEWADIEGIDSGAALESYDAMLKNIPGEGHLYRTEIDVTPESLLDWDKPISEQPRAIQKIATGGVPEFQGFIDDLAGINPEAAELAEKMMYGPESVRAGTEEASANWKKLQALVGDSDIDLNRLHDVTDAAYGRRDKWGATFYEELADSPEKASGLLSDRGIKGIKYRDGNSRGKYTARTMRDGKPYSDDITFPDERSRNEWRSEKEAEGFDVEVDDGTSNYVIFDDSLINIAERGSADPRLLAGIAAGGGGASAATALSNKLAAAQAVKERGDIRAPNSGMLHSLTMGARDLERRLEGHPISLLFPEGLVNYLEQANREERPSRETALWALLDLI